MPIELSVKSNLDKVIAEVESVFSERRLNSTIASALTAVAKESRTALQKEVRTIFDRPTPWVINGTFFTPATAQNLVAYVGWKDEGSIASGKGVPAGKSLLAEIFGGQRRDKGLDSALRYAGVLPSGYQATPGPGITLDQYGNMRGAEMVKIISGLKGFRNVGVSQNRTKGSAIRRGARLAQYFVVKPGDASHYGLGIFERKVGGIRKVINFVRTPSYKPRLKEEAIVQRVVSERLETLFTQYALQSLKRLGG